MTWHAIDIDPKRSRVSIDARSSLHPIHIETDGLDGVSSSRWTTRAIDVDRAPRGKLSSSRSTRWRRANRLEDRELHRRIDSRRYPTIDGDLEWIKPTDTRGATSSGRPDLPRRHQAIRGRHHDRARRRHTMRLSGQSAFDIRDFGMEPPRILMLKVEPEVDRAGRHRRRRDGGG